MELVDIPDLKSGGCNGRGGSSPPTGTIPEQMLDKKVLLSYFCPKNSALQTAQATLVYTHTLKNGANTMLTLTQQNAVLTFLAQLQADTLAQAVDNIYDTDKCDNSVRIYDAACVAEIFNKLANMYSTDDNNALTYTFTADDVLDALSMLDTEYRDCVVEFAMQYSDDLSCALFNKTYAQYCAEIEAKFAAMRTA